MIISFFYSFVACTHQKAEKKKNKYAIVFATCAKYSCMTFVVAIQFPTKLKRVTSLHRIQWKKKKREKRKKKYVYQCSSYNLNKSFHFLLSHKIFIYFIRDSISAIFLLLLLLLLLLQYKCFWTYLRQSRSVLSAWIRKLDFLFYLLLFRLSILFHGRYFIHSKFCWMTNISR